MTLRADSYSSIAEVVAFTRYLLDGATTFNSTTRPALTEVENFVDRASGYLNAELADAGFATPVTNTTAKLVLSGWVTERATEFVEMTQRGMGSGDQEGNRAGQFRNMSKSAQSFIQQNALGFKRLGVVISHGAAEGLAFTAQTAQADRTDQDDSSLQQPRFTIDQWSNE